MSKSKNKATDSHDHLAWKWWEEEKNATKNSQLETKWVTLRHNGPLFAPLYKPLPNRVKFYYNGKQMKLSKNAEEVAGFYAKMLEDPYTKKSVFNKNFLHDWRDVMTARERNIITDLKKCDFRDIHEFYKDQSLAKKQLSADKVLAKKKEDEKLLKKYGYCELDGRPTKIGNFKIETPGLFRGRGTHPKMGKLKRRVNPEDVCINISPHARVPKPSVKGHWKGVIHDNKVTWLASWRDNICNSMKYIFLNPTSRLKGESDRSKYEKAQKLGKCIDKIRTGYKKDFKSKVIKRQQLGVALYFIDQLALRVGNEKDKETSDTVGCCSLRVEHAKLRKAPGRKYFVMLNFPSKDSIPYRNEMGIEKKVYDILASFLRKKTSKMQLFDEINVTLLNKHLNQFMMGLSAKVFRTYNASKLLQLKLKSYTEADMTIKEKTLAYNQANRDVAILCNHKRAVPKTFIKSIDNMYSKIDVKLTMFKKFQTEVKNLKQKFNKIGTPASEKALKKKQKALYTCEKQLLKLMFTAIEKVENRNIALGTSKLNYIDPRISVSWCKKWQVPLEKIYNKTQREKFQWAAETIKNFQF